MSSLSDSQCARLDNSFGPYAGSCRGGFDFTLLFEETILTLLPSCLFLFVSPFRIRFLWNRAKKLRPGYGMASTKIFAWIAYGALQLAQLVLWAAVSANRTRASIAATAVAMATALLFCLVSYYEHDRAVRPSTLLNVYLFITLLFDITRTRTLWLRAADDLNYAIAYVSTAAVAVKTVVLALEALEKKRLLLQQYRSYPPEATAGIHNRSFFWWLNSLFRLGFSRVLDVDDLFALDKHLQATYLHARFQSAWASVDRHSTYSLLKISLGVLRWPLLQTTLPRACLIALNFCQPFLINRSILLSQEVADYGTTQIGYGLIGAFLLVYVGIAVSTGQYQHRTYRSITMLRGGLVSIIYQKTSKLNLRNVDPAASMTLMSADIERIVQGWQTVHEIWANVIEIAIAIFLLQQQLGVACVVPVAVSILSLLGSLVAMGFIMSRQALWLEAIEKRISATSSMLASMKGIKMCGLKDTILSCLQKLRVDELRISKRFRKLIIWNMIFAYVTQIFAPILSFAIFSVLARNSGNDRTLDTARVFTSLSLFVLLSEPLASLVMSLTAFMGAVGSFVRIQQFLETEERSDTRHILAELGAEKKCSTVPDAITVHEASFSWNPDKQLPLLRNINLSIPLQQLTMVVGPVGCGKSTLLHALLGEIPAEAGSVHILSTSIAYCSQDAWHTNGTIREAIVGSETFDAKWYASVVHACALSTDFEDLPTGDFSRIGSGGIALSGGQSKRIALARAVYARREMFFLDDALSGLDTSTENHVFHNLLGKNGLFRKMRSTVVLVCSSAQRLPYADNIVCLGTNGQIVEHGTFDVLRDSGGYVSSFCLSGADKISVPDVNDDKSVLNVECDVVATADLKTTEYGGVSITSAESRVSASQEETDLSRQTSDLQIYLYYVKSVGWWASFLFVFAIAGFVFCISFPTIWVKWWAADNQSQPNGRLGYWLGVYATLGGLAVLCLFVSCWQMIITMVPRSGENFHLVLLNAVLSAPMSFFSKTDSGVTMNRFSQDLQLIDMELPVAALNTVATFVLCIAQMALIGVGSTYAAISFPIVLLALYVIQKFYLRTSRQLRLLDLETKAPLYSQFEESLSGLATIRAFGWQKGLEAKHHMLLNQSQQPFYLLFAVQRWLTLVLDLVVAAVAVLLIALVVGLRGTVSAGGVGLALLNVVQFSQSIKLLVTFWTTLETHIGSVARIKSFSETTTSEDQPGEKNTPPPGWPSNGAIEFQNLCASYNGLDLVLRNVGFSIQAGEKIGICGRTGSGKTSLITTLFRMLDLQEGSIRVDGIDVTSIPRQEVRSRIVGVPQHSFLLKGSVRLNADPTGTVSDEAIRATLRSVQVLQLVDENGGLDADIDALNLSSGQKQLFCLARAMLRPSTILVLDEVTSSIDSHTEEVIQRLIRRKFANHTIIAVAHKLETIMDFDKVAVLESGQLIEFDSPYALLDIPGSAFAKLYMASLAEGEDGPGQPQDEAGEQT